MLALLIGILPFAAGVALSPTILLVQVENVAGPGGSRPRGLTYAAGGAATLLVVSGLALGLAERTGGAESSGGEIAAVKLAIAGVLVLFGLRVILRPPRPKKEPEASAGVKRRARLLGLGAVMMATNFTSLALYFPAMHQIGISSSGLPGQVLAFLLMFAATMLPALVPLLPAGRLGRALRPRLERANAFFSRHERVLVPVVAFGFAA